ncbi:MAG: signal peptidase II [Phycisphaerales bacterium]|jgi:lipoprotein signal peptidase|nr:signal peptidase II [Phycisphaerales bacterium]
MRSTRAIVFFLTLTAVALAADLLSKHYVFQSLLPDDETLAARIELIQSQTTDELTSREMLGYLNLRKKVCPGLDFVLSLNKGAVFGMEMHKSGNVHRMIVGGATLIVTIMMAGWFATSHRRAWCVHLATALILAGAMGNLYDRLASSVALPGMEPILYNVRDFLDCSSIPLPFGFSYKWVFNIADVWLVVGVGLMMIHWVAAMLSERKQQRQAEAAK